MIKGLLMMKFLKLSTLLILAILLATPGITAMPSSVSGNQLPSLAPMLKKVIPAVVDITTIGRQPAKQNPFFDLPGRYFPTPPNRYYRTRSLGSGVIVDARKGYIITNNHVIAKASQINVLLHDGRKLKAKVIGRDPDSDIAVIQIKAKRLQAIKLGNSDKLAVGDFVVAIGNPYGLGRTVTSGIVSALGRNNLGIVGYEDLIQTDAAINQGNSGGALVNLRGELIGINTAIISRSGGNIGIGFAIPVNMATKLMRQLVSHGKVRRGLLGVYIQSLTPELARGFGINPDTRGALVTQVFKGSAAAKAGLESGDIIIKANNKVIKSANSLRNTIGLLSIGQSVDLVYIRNRREYTTRAMLASSSSSKQKVSSAISHPQLKGAVIGEIPANHPNRRSISGVMILDVNADSRAWHNRLRKGDIITRVNDVRVTNVAQFKRALSKSRKAILLNVIRGQGALYLYLE